MNSLWHYNLTKLMGNQKEWLWANPPFSVLDKFVTKMILQPCRVILVHPDWVDSYWSPLLRKISLHRLQVGSGQAIYVKDKSKKPLKSPLWNTQISMVDTFVQKVDFSELDPLLVKFVQRHDRNWGLKELRFNVETLRGEPVPRVDDPDDNNDSTFIHSKPSPSHLRSEKNQIQVCEPFLKEPDEKKMRGGLKPQINTKNP